MTVRVLGKHFKNLSFNGNAAYVGVLFTPQENVNGILLYDVQTWEGNVISVGAVAPTNNTSRDLAVIFQGTMSFEPIMIPAGQGVFMQLISSYNIPALIRWDFLNADGTVA